MSRSSSESPVSKLVLTYGDGTSQTLSIDDRFRPEDLEIMDVDRYEIYHADGTLLLERANLRALLPFERESYFLALTLICSSQRVQNYMDKHWPDR